MNYKEIMGNDTRTFPDIYEKEINKLEKKYKISSELSDMLKEKRAFGLEKYKEFSFQSNFENAIKSPSWEHLKEELIDAFNYLFHEMYKQYLMGNKVDRKTIKTLRCLIRTWSVFKTVKN